MREALSYRARNKVRFVAELKEFIRFASISSQPEHAAEVRRCAGWLSRHLKKIGLDRVTVFRGKAHPIVYGEWLGAVQRPTVLIYGHYDVQPVDPSKEWKYPPFRPVIVKQNLYGRGASDDKGQMFTHVKAIECWLRTAGEMPVNVKCLFEGEEEIGSPSLASFIDRNKRALKADAVVVSDTQMLAAEQPAISYSERGALSLELEVRGPGHDLHSGNFGGAVHNPAQVLCEIVGRLHDKNGRVAISGFYDRVRSSGRVESGRSDAQVLEAAGVQSGWGESGFSAYERTTVRPALTVNGLSGGYQGQGGKGVIPSRATAKLSFRLVPDQDPGEIEQLFRRHVVTLAPGTVRAEVRTLSAAKPVVVDPRNPAIQAAALAYKKSFGVSPQLMRSGGTIPPVVYFHETLGAPVVLMGFGLPDDRIHAPNEKFYLPNFFRGIDTSIRFLAGMASRTSKGTQ